MVRSSCWVAAALLVACSPDCEFFGSSSPSDAGTRDGSGRDPDGDVVSGDGGTSGADARSGESDADTQARYIAAIRNELNEFCDAVATVCTPLQSCSCGRDARNDCFRATVLDCRENLTGDGVVEAIAAGTMRFDGDVAADVVAELVARAQRCEPPYELWTQRDGLTFHGAFTGAVAPGEACLVSGIPGDCFEGLCRHELCVGFSDEGGDCVANINPFMTGNLCAELDAVLGGGLRCNPDSLKCEVPPQVPVGGVCGLEACAEGLWCQTDGADEDRCVARLEAGEPCASEVCGDGLYCSSVSDSCMAHEPIGGPCTRGFQCSSSVCFLGQCVPTVCRDHLRENSYLPLPDPV